MTKEHYQSMLPIPGEKTWNPPKLPPRQEPKPETTPTPQPKKQFHQPKTNKPQHPATCHKCQQPTTVPFKPKNPATIKCRPCWKKTRN